MLSFKKSNGYTLMELLVVIAIIGVLAGLIFPVAAGAKRRAKQAQCMNNLYQIYLAVKQFQLDEHRYPEFIAGPVQWLDAKTGKYTYWPGSTIVQLSESTGMIGGTNGGNGRAVSLFPEYINHLNLLKCPFAELGWDYTHMTKMAGAAPSTRPYTLGMLNPTTNPQQDDDSICEDPMYAVLKGFSMGPVPFRGKGLTQVGGAQGAFWLYKYSSYDLQTPPNLQRAANDAGEVHYCPAWSDYDPTKPLSIQPGVARQLRWRTPPEDTVITWCSFHRNTDGTGTPSGGSKDIVLFLDGHVDQRPSPALEPWLTAGWQVTP